LTNSIDGILDKGNNDVFSKNWIINDWEALLIYQTSGHIITQNRIENNTEAINTYNGEGLEIYDNNFINNQRNVATVSDAFSYPPGGGGGTLPPWDNSKVGNYWSDYMGVDANHDGVGDIKYIVRSDIYTVDRYPLISRFDITEPSIIAAASPSEDTSPTLPSNDNADLSSSTSTTHLPNSSIMQSNTHLQVIIAIIAAALAAYLIVLIVIVTIGRKNKTNSNNQGRVLRE
jgi:hypothetical protein